MKKIVFGCLISLAMFTKTEAQVAYIGHRGASYVAPENTVASAKLGWEVGADAVEIDIQLTKDNRVMVHHDSNTKRQTGVDRKIKDTTSEELRKLDAGSFKDEKYKGEKIPFLEEIVSIIPEGKLLVIEIKCGSEVIPFTKEIIDASGKKDQIKFISFGWQTILDAKKAFPDNKCYWLSSVGPDVKLKIKDAAKHGLDGLDLRNTIIDAKMMKNANKLGLEMICWTVDDPQEAKRMIALGVQGITTNRPDWLKEQVNAK
ncbi:MAG TPA: glycerophosphodiester phosphodiesterase [Prolixibacteraceae bacterium]|nr:glycerophosphodiester phosphodiesterase [Prolixibacteraceae bacterium]HCR90899.1 glycerophosphodiester phosphodiesterase [Prolixibacteraceae bacterium]HCU60434.1 glycerophosphodiester phosphodiesterase [Prolixibacteraceae bacterium]